MVLSHKTSMSLLQTASNIGFPLKNSKYNGLFIELKRIKGGSVSKEQKDFISFLNNQGYLAVVCKGHKEAIVVIEHYLALLV